METLKQKIKELVKLTDRDTIVCHLQDLEEFILRNYCMQLNDHIIYPKEIEIYYSNKNARFEDTTMHVHDEQKDNFNHTYLHGAGMDICLSDEDDKEEDYYLSILVRGGQVDGKFYYRPLTLYDAVTPSAAKGKEVLFAQPNPICKEQEIYFAVRQGVQKMTQMKGTIVRQEDKELILRAVVAPIKELSSHDFPGKMSFVYGEIKRRKICDKKEAEDLSRKIYGGMADKLYDYIEQNKES